ncbi:RCC1 domain-containing protein [Corallococcus sicarius]|nr:RCC1 repeat-containing protein [Corallococcus sicarius]
MKPEATPRARRSLWLCLSLGLLLGCGPSQAPDAEPEAHFTEQAAVRQSLRGQVTAGTEHALVVLPDGVAFAWGRNLEGQLGTGDTLGRSLPLMVAQAQDTNGPQRPLQRVRAVAAGAKSSLALQADGTVWAWGDNSQGQLGLGTTGGTNLLARQLPGLTRIISVAAGRQHALALREDGTVWAWGSNLMGQVGAGAEAGAVPAPVQVPGLTGVAGIACGADHSLARKADGTVWAWGSNAHGQLGAGTSASSSRLPIRVMDEQGAALTRVVELAAGAEHGLALREDGTVWAWGFNSNGQLGNGLPDSQQAAPTQVKNAQGTGPLSNIVSITGGNWHSLAVDGEGHAWAWGFNIRGQLGDGSTTRRFLPIAVQDTAGTGVLSGLKALAAGDNFSLAVGSDGRLWAWGYNFQGQLGLGDKVNRSRPTPSAGATGRGWVVTHYDRTLAAHADGTLWVSGRNHKGQLGTGTTTSHAAPVQLTLPSGVVNAAISDSHSLAVLTDGSVWAWGDNVYGQLGFTDGQPRLQPSRIPGLTNMVAVAAAPIDSVALRTDGTVWTWGNRLAVGTPLPGVNALPRQVEGLEGVVAIAAGSEYAVALRADGTVWAWAYFENTWYDPEGPAPLSMTPTPVQGLEQIVSISRGGLFMLALRADGSIWSWGEPGAYQAPHSTQPPTPVQSLTGVIAVSAGYNHALAVCADGTIWSWGNNGYGQLGDGSMMPRALPAQVPGLSDGVAVAAATYGNSLAVRADGTVWAWGNNSYGQLGTGTTYYALRTPVPSLLLP